MTNQFYVPRFGDLERDYARQKYGALNRVLVYEQLAALNYVARDEGIMQKIYRLCYARVPQPMANYVLDVPGCAQLVISKAIL